ncbi:MAG: hypothetical protein JSW71_14800 [Gemmatimonadota bacterium]|nr:MAG: hypothetical protein JSW71_14800 [Gemmatimonadota bacterium]
MKYASQPPTRAILLCTVAAVLFNAPATAQERFGFFDRGPYRQAVPRPDDLLGYPAGERQTQYSTQQAVLDSMMAAAGDRVRTEVIGVTEEGRTMRILIVSSPENIARLDEIRSDVTRLADPRSTSAAEASRIAVRTPLVVMLSYSIHGNEPAGFEAAMWVAYQLLASDEPVTLEMLRNAVVVLNPAANPDGHERFAVWYNSLFVGSDEPAAYEWDEPWGIWGRYGHYRFDMNRDMIALAQAPTRAMLAGIVRWRPQVFVDLHSTTEQYFFAPPSRPINQNIPDRTARWLETFGRGNAAAFDRYGWQYYTRETFDLFYPGYFDASPSLHGATGMTYETDGGKALKRRRGDGTVISLMEGIAHHYVASLATVETAAANREERLLDYYHFRRSAIEDAQSATMKRVVIQPGFDQSNAARLVANLLRHDIEVTRITEPYSARATHDYMAGPGAMGERHVFQPGALVIDLAQPQGRLAKALLEPLAELDTEFVQEQLDKFARNERRGDDAASDRYGFYDVTAWSLPYAMGLSAFWTEDLDPVVGSRLTLPATGDPVRGLAPAGGVSGRGRSAYVFRNDRLASAELAVALTREGFVINVATEPLSADGRDYPRGAFVIRTTRNPDSLHDRLAALAQEIGVTVDPVNSAFPEPGGVGVGSGRVRPVFAPRVLVASGDAVSLTSYGALWHFLETELRQPFVPVSLGSIGGMTTLSDYNVLIIPNASSGAIRRELGDGGIQRLRQWIRDGGVLIVYGSAVLFPGDEDVGLSSVKALSLEDDENGESGDSLVSDPSLTPPLVSPTAGFERPVRLPGSIFRATLDQSHWLTLGYEQQSLAVMVQGGTFLEPSESGDNPVAFVGDDLLLSGWAWPDHTEQALQGTVWAATERQGRGNVVMISGDLLFRGFWRGPAKLLTNAMLFGTGR